MAPLNTIWKQWRLTKMTHDKYSNIQNRQIWHPQKMGPLKNGTPCEKIPKGYLPRAELSEFLNLLYDSDSRSWDFKDEFFHSRVIFLLLSGVYLVLVVLLIPIKIKPISNLVVRCHFCEMHYIGCYFYEVVFLIRGVPFLWHYVKRLSKNSVLCNLRIKRSLE